MNEDLASESLGVYQGFYSDLVARHLMTADQSAICARYVNYTQDYDALSDVDVVFECVVESLEVKHSVYRVLEDKCPNLQAICSVSSAIVADRLAEGMSSFGDRILVTHPFYPPHLVPYFEIARGRDTADAVTRLAVELLEALGREPVVLKNAAPGFIGNRLQFALWREALYIVESGIADPRDIDTCLMYSFCPRYTSVGIFEHFDVGGLELNANVCNALFPELCDSKEVMKSISERIETGKLGQRAGTGFYDWRDVDMKAYGDRVSEPYWAYFNFDIPEE
jgi:3-hydroxybutyryl-CoA dehydrogenase